MYKFSSCCLDCSDSAKRSTAFCYKIVSVLIELPNADKMSHRPLYGSSLHQRQKVETKLTLAPFWGILSLCEARTYLLSCYQTHFPIYRPSQVLLFHGPLSSTKGFGTNLWVWPSWMVSQCRGDYPHLEFKWPKKPCVECKGHMSSFHIHSRMR